MSCRSSTLFAVHSWKMYKVSHENKNLLQSGNLPPWRGEGGGRPGCSRKGAPTNKPATGLGGRHRTRRHTPADTPTGGVQGCCNSSNDAKDQPLYTTTGGVKGKPVHTPVGGVKGKPGHTPAGGVKGIGTSSLLLKCRL